jgi:hypothetical protein
MKPQFGPRRRRWLRETRRGAGAVRHTNGDLQIFRPVIPPRLSPESLSDALREVQRFSL